MRSLPRAIRTCSVKVIDASVPRRRRDVNFDPLCISNIPNNAASSAGGAKTISMPHHTMLPPNTLGSRERRNAQHRCHYRITGTPSHQRPPPTLPDSCLASLLHPRYQCHTYIYNQRHSPSRSPKIRSNHPPLSSSSRPMSSSPETFLLVVAEPAR